MTKGTIVCNPKPGLRCQKDALHDLDQAADRKAHLEDLTAQGLDNLEPDLIVASRALDRRQRQFDLYVMHAGPALEVQYRLDKEKRDSLPPEKRFDVDDPRTRVVTRYRELTEWRHRSLSEEEVKQHQEHFNYLQTLATAAHNIGLYLASLKRNPEHPRLPAHPTRVLQMFDYLASAPKSENGRNLTPEEEALYAQAKIDEKTATPIAEMTLEEREAALTQQLQEKLRKSEERRKGARTKAKAYAPSSPEVVKQVNPAFAYGLPQSVAPQASAAQTDAPQAAPTQPPQPRKWSFSK